MHRNLNLMVPLAVSALVLAVVSTAEALPQIDKEFKAKYVTPNPDTPFAKAAAEAKCNVCHVDGEKKTVRNPFGQALGKLIGEGIKDQFKQDAPAAQKRTQDALEKVAQQPSGGKDSPTFGALIAQGKLPGAAAGAPPAQDPTPAEQPMPEKPPVVKVDPAPPSVEEQQAIDVIHKIGGAVYPLAMGDDRKSVSFHLGGTGLDDSGLSYVKGVANVYELNLKDTQITDAGLAHLAGMKSLVKLHLEKTAVTDAGLKQLAGLENLEYLNLYGTGVTDEGLKQLEGLKNLKKLYLWMSQVSDEGVKQLQAKLPELTIVK